MKKKTINLNHGLSLKIKPRHQLEPDALLSLFRIIIFVWYKMRDIHG